MTGIIALQTGLAHRTIAGVRPATFEEYCSDTERSELIGEITVGAMLIQWYRRYVSGDVLYFAHCPVTGEISKAVVSHDITIQPYSGVSADVREMRATG